MKREFLQNFKVNDQPLPKEIIDAIMDENGKDIQAAKKPYADYQTIKDENQRLKEQQVDGLVDGKNAQQWKEAHDKAVSDHKTELDGIKFQHTLDAAILGAKGKNAKAITACLDVDTLRGSEDQQKAINDALEALKKESGYLFDDGAVPPPYASGTGTQHKQPPAGAQDTLASALRARYEKG